jgi:hypothetical protein
MSTPTENILPDLSDLAVKKPRVDDLPDSLVQGILKNESGGHHYDSAGRVKMGPPTRSGSRAVGKWQVMPDAPGGRTRTVGGQTFDLYDEAQNDAAGRAYLKEGYDKAGGDERGAALYYFGGPRALNHFKKTGRLPKGSDGYTPISTYVQNAAGGRQAPAPTWPDLSDLSTQPAQAAQPPDLSDLSTSQPPAPTPPSQGEAGRAVSPTVPAGPQTPAIKAAAPQPIESGNIDLARRPVVHSPDGTISTVRSISVGIDGREVLIPTVSDDGKVLTDRQAIDLYKRTGKHLGVFDSPEAATAYAKTLHEQQAQMYGGQGGTTSPQHAKVSSRALSPEEEEAALNPPLAAPNLKPYDPDAGLSAPARLAQAAQRMTVRQPGYDEGVLEPVTVSIPMKGVNAPPEYDVRGERPAASEVVDALMEKLGPGWKELGQRYRAETGREPIDPRSIPEPGVSITPGEGYTPLPGREWNYTISPSRDFIDTMTAYQKGGIEEASRVATERAHAKVSGRNKSARDEASKPYLGNPALAFVSPLALLPGSQVGDDVLKGAAKTMQGTAQLAENLRKIHEGEAFGDANQEKIDEARAAVPGFRTNLGGALGTGLEVGGDVARMTMLPGVSAPLEQFLENYQRGGLEAAKAAGSIAALEAVGVGGDKISKLLELTPVQRQVFVRALQGDTMAAQAAMQDEKGAALLKSFAVGAAFPVGEGERVEAEPVAPKIAPTERTARQSYLDMPDIPVRQPEGVRVRKASESAQADTGTPESVPAAETSVAGQQASNSPVVEPVHHSEIQPRAEGGQFRRVTTKDLREARENAFDQTSAEVAPSQTGAVRADGQSPAAQADNPTPQRPVRGMGQEGEPARVVNAAEGAGGPPGAVEGGAGRLNAPDPATLREGFKQAILSKFKLPERQAEAVATVTDALDEGLTKWGLERGSLLGRVSVESGRGEGAELNQAAHNAPTFYSQAQRAVEGIRQEKMQPAQLRAMLEKGGVKNEELKWTGLDDFIAQKAVKGESVTKSQALEFLKQNEVKVEEVVKSGQSSPVEGVQQFGGGSTKFSQYTLPGSKEGSYRELLLTLPVERSSQRRAWESERDRLFAKYGTKSQIELERRATKEEFAALQSLGSQMGQDFYKSSHYDEPNILAHVRFNERTDADGKRVLFVEEVQSDWHQEGRRKGYREPGERPSVPAGWADTGNARGTGSVPAAPFAKTWHELAMKRVLRYAAENGYDKVAWTTGETQAARYDLSKQVKRVSYNFDTNQLTAVDLHDNPALSKEVAPDKLEDYVGKELAQKIVDAQGEGKKFVTLAGEDLKVGGEGMKGFYDRILPSFAQKYGRKWGARVGETAVKAGEKLERAHSIEITDAMRRSVMEEGQPLFQSNRAATSFLADGRAVIRALDSPDVSTGAHEIHHVFAPKLAEATLKTPDATLKETGEAFFKWMGFKGAEEFSTLHGRWVDGRLTDAEKAKYVSGQETGARGFERYLNTGKAPSEQLRRVFEDFKVWLSSIYGAIRGKNHPLSGKVSDEAIKAWDSVLGAPKGDYGQLTHQLHKAPSEGTPAFFENAQIKRALRLKPDASTEDVRWALARETGKPRSSHVTPEDLTKWADSKNLQGAAREALDAAVSRYKESIKAPTAYEQTGIRRRNVNPETQSLAEFVRAAGGLRADRDGANAGELRSFTNRESGSSGLVRRGGVSAHDMARMAAEAGYPVAEGGGYYQDEGFMERGAGVGEPSVDTFLEALSRDLGGDRVYSHQREVDYEEQYRKEHPDDNTDALDSFLANESNGILFDKVHDGTATRRETEEFRRVAAEGGLFPEYVSTVISAGKRAKAEGVQAPVGDEAGTDFDFRDDPLDDGDKPDFLYQSSRRPEQLGFVQEGLTQQDARREQSKPQLDDAKTDAAKRALGTEGYARLSELKSSPVARVASEVEKRVTPQNAASAPDLLKALSTLAELKRQKQSVTDYLRQDSLFGGRDLSREQERMLARLDANPRKLLDELLPAEAEPQQDMLFQSSNSSSRRQKAYRALLEARGQESLSPEMRANPRTRTRMGAGKSTDPNQPALSDELTRPLRKATFGEKVADIANVPRSLKSSIDLSAAMRQGAMFTLTHPAKAARIFFGSQLKSLSNKGYESFKSQLSADPDVRLMRDSGLHLTSLADGKITNREEAFASKLAGKVPLVRRTENAYVTFLDAARSQWFKQLKTQAEDAAQKANRPVTKAQYEAIARFVNRATGRGDLGKGAVNDAAPLLNSLFFAPRYAVSKLQVLDPRTYSHLPAGARKQAVRQAAQYFATVGATAALLKYGFGAQVGTDPEDSDFLKVKLGDTRYDLTAGSGSYMVFAARVARNLSDRANDKEAERNKGLEDNVKRFLRYKLAPVPAAALNAYQKRDAVGKETSVGKEALGLITPLYLADLYDAFKQEGAAGLAKTTPGFVGVGVQTYSDEPKGSNFNFDRARDRRAKRATR